MTIIAGSTALAEDFITTSSGASDSGKGVKLDANGLLDDSFMPTDITNQVDKVLLDASATDVANNTTNETNVFSYTVPAGALGTNNGYRIKMYITDLSYSSTNSTCTLRLKYDNSTIATIVIDPSGGDNAELKGYLEAFLFANASASAQRGGMMIELSQNQLDPQVEIGASTIQFIKAYASGTATEDSTGALSLVVSVQWGEASVDNDFTVDAYTVEIIR